MRFFSAVGSILIALTVFAAPAMAAEQSVSDVLVEALHSKGVLDDTTYTDIKNTEAAGGQQALDRKLVEIMHNKGLIDDATYGKLSAQAEAVASAPAPVQPAPVQTAYVQPAAPVLVQAAPERPFDKSLSSLEEGFARLGGDTVKLKIGTWFQGGWAYDDRKGGHAISLPFDDVSAPSANTSNSAYMRFARLYFNGTLDDKFGFRIMVDGAGGTTTLNDAYVWFDYIPYTRVTFGQFLTPFGDDSWHAPFDLPMINYALITDYMQFANFRDVGLMVSSKYVTPGPWPVGAGIATAIINGSNKNVIDTNSYKDWIGRAWINPFIPGLSVGGSWYLGKVGAASNHDWQRWGADFDYAPPSGPAKGLMLRGEYAYQRKFIVAKAATEDTVGIVGGVPTVIPGTPAVEGTTQSRGWYVEGAYRLNPLPGFLANFEPTLRYEQLEELNVSSSRIERTTVGLNYWLNKYTRLLANYEMYDTETGVNGDLNGTHFAAGKAGNHDVTTVNFQIWF